MKILINNDVVGEGKFCKSVLCQTLGLMFSKQKNLVFEFKRERMIGLHMFFVFYPIDLVFLDSSMNVVELKSNLRPFRTYISKQKVRYVLELREGIIENNNIKLNDRISFKK
jgi:uncharacterized protein